MPNTYYSLLLRDIYPHTRIYTRKHILSKTALLRHGDTPTGTHTLALEKRHVHSFSETQTFARTPGFSVLFTQEMAVWPEGGRAPLMGCRFGPVTLSHASPQSSQPPHSPTHAHSPTAVVRRGKELKTYWDYKQAAQTYQQAWLQLRTQAFPLWPRSPRDLLLFQ